MIQHVSEFQRAPLPLELSRGALHILAEGKGRLYLQCRYKLEEPMRVRIQKWGNSLALRIPKSFAVETALDSGGEVDLTLEGGRIIVTPLEAPSYSLGELLARITPSNLHSETDTGPGAGAEVW